MTNELTEFNYEGNVIRTFGTKKEPWFAAVDVLKTLGIHTKNISRILDKLDDDEKMLINLSTGKQINDKDMVVNLTTISSEDFVGDYAKNPVLWLVSEPGLYRILFRSDNPKARVFTRFVIHDVMPSIREYGYYVNPKWEKYPNRESGNLRMDEN